MGFRPVFYSPVNNLAIPLSGHTKTSFDIFQKGILRMNSLVSTIETLGHRIERWAAMISDCLATTLAGILLSVLQLKAQLSEPMVAKLEAIGRSCELFRRKAHNGTVRSATARKARTKVDDDLSPLGV